MVASARSAARLEPQAWAGLSMLVLLVSMGYSV
jgi:hypothetical protein